MARDDPDQIICDFLQSMREQHGIVLATIDHETDHFAPLHMTDAAAVAMYLGEHPDANHRERLAVAAETGTVT